MAFLESWWGKAALVAVVALLLAYMVRKPPRTGTRPPLAQAEIPPSLKAPLDSPDADPRAAVFASLHPSPRVAVVAGATGEIGRALVARLMATPLFDEVVVVGRRPLEVDGAAAGARKVRNVVVEDLAQLSVAATAADVFGDDAARAQSTVAYCCLGTTRAKAGAEGFVRVDRTLVSIFGAAARAAGVPHFSVVTAANANADSSLLYPQTKGLVERDLREMNFERLTIMRPALLVGERWESRLVEDLAMHFVPLMEALGPHKWTVRYEEVAAAMLRNTFAPEIALRVATNEGLPGEAVGRGDSPVVEIVDNERIVELAHANDVGVYQNVLQELGGSGGLPSTDAPGAAGAASTAGGAEHGKRD